jgi:hypothetical protein
MFLTFILLIILLYLVFYLCSRNGGERYNAWNRPDFKDSSVAPKISSNNNQGIGFERPDCQSHPNCLGCPKFIKSKLDLNTDPGPYKGKIALLFLTKNGIVFDKLWSQWNKIPDRFSTFIHEYKNSKVEHSYDNIVPVMAYLVDQALLDPEIKGVVFITESCVPVKSSAYFYKYLINKNSTLGFVNENLDKAHGQPYLTRSAMELLSKNKNVKAKGHTDKMSNGGNDELLIPQLLKKSNIPTDHGFISLCCIFVGCADKLWDLDKIETKQFRFKNPNSKIISHYDPRSVTVEVPKKMIDKLLESDYLMSRKYEYDCEIPENGLLRDYLLNKLMEIPEQKMKLKKNIISYSLWGQAKLYNYGALENAIIAKELYPNFIVRIYYMNADNTTIKELEKMDNVELVHMKKDYKQSNMFWRFIPMFEENVDTVLVRDTDDLLTIGERDMVNEWLKSDKDFHIVRSVKGSHGAVIIGNMFGCRNGVLVDSIDKFLNYGTCGEYGDDQHFLAMHVYPYMREKNKIFAHDDINTHVYGVISPDFKCPKEEKCTQYGSTSQKEYPVEPDAHKRPDTFNQGSIQTHFRPKVSKILGLENIQYKKPYNPHKVRNEKLEKLEIFNFLT